VALSRSEPCQVADSQVRSSRLKTEQRHLRHERTSKGEQCSWQCYPKCIPAETGLAHVELKSLQCSRKKTGKSQSLFRRNSKFYACEVDCANINVTGISTAFLRLGNTIYRSDIVCRFKYN
jgi:hypothetical protein